MKGPVRAIALLLCIAGVFLGLPLSATNIVNTRHNLSITGPGLIKATSEDRICIFCHTPHNAAPQTPLWNKNLNAVNYTLYSSSTMAAIQSQPTGPSRLCLSCHDGTLALGMVITSGSWNASGQPVPIGMQNVSGTGGIPSTSTSYFGTSLSGDHPASFSYYNSLPNTELSPVLPSELLFYGNGTIHCTTCHDPHDNTNKKFLRVNSVNSRLCILCHVMSGWSGTPHNTAPNTWNEMLPNPWPKTWTGTDFGWTTVQENGCENCHDSHKAIGQKRLLNCYTESGPCNPATEEGVCYPCHNGHMNPPVKNIFKQLNYTSRHTVDLYTGIHDPKESPRLISNHVECVDCHNPHMTNNDKAATPPAVSGRLDGVSGVTIDDTIATPAINEYEICFKCHASSTAQSIFPPIPRVVNNVNMRLGFQTINPSFHPVAGPGASGDVPSLIPQITRNGQSVTLSLSSTIYCTDCHSDESETGSRGPHGSKYTPILRDQYDTSNSLILYSTSNFTLCYDCHYETIILQDITFQRNTSSNKGGHSGHVGNPSVGNPVYAPCSACHDPHGIPDNGLSGSHKRLINFDTRIVSALGGAGFSVPIFAGSGNRQGNCALVCHGVTHDGSSKFSYGGFGAIGPGNIQIRW